MSWALRLSAKTAFLEVEEVAVWVSGCLEDATVVHDDMEAEVLGRESSRMVL